MAEAARRPRLVLEIDVGERLPVGVADMKHCRSSLGSGSSTDQGGGKRCAIVTAFAVAQHAAQAFARFVDARGGESGLQRCGVFRTLLVKQKDAAFMRLVLERTVDLLVSVRRHKLIRRPARRCISIRAGGEAAEDRNPKA
jgi:hypothetical protein